MFLADEAMVGVGGPSLAPRLGVISVRGKEQRETSSHKLSARHVQAQNIRWHVRFFFGSD